MLLLLNEHGDPSFLFPNLSSYNINNHLAKFEKNLSVGSILEEWPWDVWQAMVARAIEYQKNCSEPP